MSLAAEIQRAIDESARKLLQRAVPPVKYWLLRDIDGRGEEDIVLQNAIDERIRYPPRVRLLASLGEDGTWPIPKDKRFAEDEGPGPPIGDTYRTMLFNLQQLRQYGVTVEDGNVRAVLEKILGWQTKEGYIPGPWTDAFPLPHFNGHALHRLQTFEFGDHSGTKRLAEWLLKIQRHDGGWNIPYEMDVHYLPEYRAMRIGDFREFIKNSDKSQFDLKSFTNVPSCIWCTMLVVWGLCQNDRLASIRQVRLGAEFFLDRFFKRNPHPNFYRSESHWTNLKYPIRFGSGLMALAVLTMIGYGQNEPRMEKPIRWLLSQRSHDGLWTQTGRPNANADQWISMIAMGTLKRFLDVQ